MPLLLSRLLTNPATYTTLFAVILAYYLVWAHTKQQYLGVNRQFSLISLWLISMIVGWSLSQLMTALVGGSIPTTATGVWQIISAQPGVIDLLAGYGIAALVAIWYLRRVRYPIWRMIDIALLGVVLVEIGIALGLLLDTTSWLWAGLTLAASVIAVVQLITLYRSNKPGISTSCHLLGVGLVSLGLIVLFAAWHQSVGIVEYTSSSLAVIIGVISLVSRWFGLQRYIAYAQPAYRALAQFKSYRKRWLARLPKMGNTTR